MSIKPYAKLPYPHTLDIPDDFRESLDREAEEREHDNSRQTKARREDHRNQ